MNSLRGGGGLARSWRTVVGLGVTAAIVVGIGLAAARVLAPLPDLAGAATPTLLGVVVVGAEVVVLWLLVARGGR